jgi:hypothetical protein
MEALYSARDSRRGGQASYTHARRRGNNSGGKGFEKLGSHPSENRHPAIPLSTSSPNVKGVRRIEGVPAPPPRPPWWAVSRNPAASRRPHLPMPLRSVNESCCLRAWACSSSVWTCSCNLVFSVAYKSANPR